MTTPTPQAQDDERARLLSDANTWAIMPEGIQFQWKNRAVSMIRTQSAELAALRAQVEGLRKCLESCENYLRRGGSAVDLHVRINKTLAASKPKPTARIMCPECHGVGGGRGIDGIEVDCSHCDGHGDIAPPQPAKTK